MAKKRKVDSSEPYPELGRPTPAECQAGLPILSASGSARDYRLTVVLNADRSRRPVSLARSSQPSYPGACRRKSRAGRARANNKRRRGSGFTGICCLWRPTLNLKRAVAPAEQKHWLLQYSQRQGPAWAFASYASLELNLLRQVRTILSQNTTDTTSHRAFSKLKKHFPTWEDVMQAPAGLSSHCPMTAAVQGPQNQI